MIDPNAAWAEYSPDQKNPWSRKLAGHLLRRATCGFSRVDLDRAEKAGSKAAVDALLAGRDGLGEFEAESDSLAGGLIRADEKEKLPGWFLHRLWRSPHPLREKMALCWHNHFATSLAKVNDAGFMVEHYQAIYADALGDFARMTQALAVDPAMMIWLDAAESKKAMPNENFARELMELFTLGIGHYTEHDIREAAKAFTGYRVRDRKGTLLNSQHDDGRKTVFGKSGAFAGPDVVKLCLSKPESARFVARKLCVFLVGDQLPFTDEAVEPVAAMLRKEWSIAAAVGMILRSKLFFSAQAYRAKIKSPVEFCGQIVLGLEGSPAPTKVAEALGGLGQRLFYPPSVKGWDGGPAWLNAQTVIGRQNLALELCSARRRLDDGGYAALPCRLGAKTPEKLFGVLADLFFQGDLPPMARDAVTANLEPASVPIHWGEEFRRERREVALCHRLLCLPEFQAN